MHEEAHTEIDYGSVKRIVIGVVDVAPFDRIGPNENSFETELVDRALRFIDGELYVLYRNDANAHQAPAICRAIIVKPIVVGATQRSRVGFFLHRRQIEPRGRKQQPALDAVSIHGRETLL